MIGSITGKIKHCDDVQVIIDANGVGYKIFITPKTSSTLKKLPSEENTTLWTHLAVRENAMDLYGFILQDELSWFEKLISISGIGPKSAMSIVSMADPEILFRAVQANDPEYLHKTSGIGLKTANKIVMGLKEKIDTDQIANSKQTNETSLVFDALVSLGYSPAQSRAVLSNSDSSLSVQDQIKEALKKLR